MSPVIVMLPVRFQYLAVEGVDFVLIFHAVGSKFQFIDAIIQLVVPFREVRFRKAQLSQNNLLRLFQADQPVGVQIFFADGNGRSIEITGSDGLPDSFRHIFEKIIVRRRGSLHQLHDDILFMSLYGLIEVAGFIHPAYQVIDHRAAFFSLIVRITGDDGFAVLVHSFQRRDHSTAVVLDFNFRIDAEKDRACCLRNCCSEGLGGSGGLRLDDGSRRCGRRFRRGRAGGLRAAAQQNCGCSEGEQRGQQGLFQIFSHHIVVSFSQ